MDRGKFHVQDISGRRDTIGRHPKQSHRRDGHIVPRRRQGSKEHDAKRRNDQAIWFVTKVDVITKGRENVGNILEYRDHGDRVGLETGHTGE